MGSNTVEVGERRGEGEREGEDRDLDVTVDMSVLEGVETLSGRRRKASVEGDTKVKRLWLKVSVDARMLLGGG